MRMHRLRLPDARHMVRHDPSVAADFLIDAHGRTQAICLNTSLFLILRSPSSLKGR